MIPNSKIKYILSTNQKKNIETHEIKIQNNIILKIFFFLDNHMKKSCSKNAGIINIHNNKYPLKITQVCFII
jgi:hypothetical protein